MSEQAGNRSRDLDEVRQLLFPRLSPADGWARIDRAIEGATDDEHWAAIEEAAKQQDLRTDLLAQLQTPRTRPPE